MMVLIFIGQSLLSKTAVWNQVYSRDGDVAPPDFISISFRSISIMQDHITHSRLKHDKADIVIDHLIGHIEPHQLHRAAEAIEEGEKATEKLMPQIIQALEKKRNGVWWVE